MPRGVHSGLGLLIVRVLRVLQLKMRVLLVSDIKLRLVDVCIGRFEHDFEHQACWYVCCTCTTYTLPDIETV